MYRQTAFLLAIVALALQVPVFADNPVGNDRWPAPVLTYIDNAETDPIKLAFFMAYTDIVDHPLSTIGRKHFGTFRDFHGYPTLEYGPATDRMFIRVHESILYFAGRFSSLTPVDLERFARTTEAVHYIENMADRFLRIKYNQQSPCVADMLIWLNDFEAWLPDKNFFLDYPTITDVAIYTMVNKQLCALDNLLRRHCSRLPKLSKIIASFSNLPRVQAYEKTLGVTTTSSPKTIHYY